MICKEFAPCSGQANTARDRSFAIAMDTVHIALETCRDQPIVPELEALTRAKNTERARQVERCWYEGRPIAGSVSQTYLRGTRGIGHTVPFALLEYQKIHEAEAHNE